MAVEDNPFNDHHYELMCRGSESCQKTRTLLEKLGRAGLDTSLQLQENQQHYDFFAGMKREFFPDRT
jgi:hypothetical protein